MCGLYVLIHVTIAVSRVAILFEDYQAHRIDLALSCHFAIVVVHRLCQSSLLTRATVSSCFANAISNLQNRSRALSLLQTRSITQMILVNPTGPRLLSHAAIADCSSLQCRRSILPSGLSLPNGFPIGGNARGLSIKLAQLAVLSRVVNAVSFIFVGQRPSLQGQLGVSSHVAIAIVLQEPLIKLASPF